MATFVLGGADNVLFINKFGGPQRDLTKRRGKLFKSPPVIPHNSNYSLTWIKIWFREELSVYGQKKKDQLKLWDKFQE